MGWLVKAKGRAAVGVYTTHRLTLPITRLILVAALTVGLNRPFWFCWRLAHHASAFEEAKHARLLYFEILYVLV